MTEVFWLLVCHSLWIHWHQTMNRIPSKSILRLQITKWSLLSFKMPMLLPNNPKVLLLKASFPQGSSRLSPPSRPDEMNKTPVRPLKMSHWKPSQYCNYLPTVINFKKENVSLNDALKMHHSSTKQYQKSWTAENTGFGGFLQSQSISSSCWYVGWGRGKTSEMVTQIFQPKQWTSEQAYNMSVVYNLWLKLNTFLKKPSYIFL